MAKDWFEPSDHNLSAPARRAFAITPDNTNEIDPLPKAVRFNTAGTVALRAVDSAADVSLTVAAGEVLALRVSHIRATGTTATGIVGFS